MYVGHDPLGPSGLQASGSSAPQPWLAAALPSWRWWAARALMAQQRALGGRSAAIQAALDELMPPVLLHYDSVAAAESARGPAHRVHIHTCLLQYVTSSLQLTRLPHHQPVGLLPGLAFWM